MEHPQENQRKEKVKKKEVKKLEENPMSGLLDLPHFGSFNEKMVGEEDKYRQQRVSQAKSSCPAKFAYTGDFYARHACTPTCHAHIWYTQDQAADVEAWLAVSTAVAFVAALVGVAL